MQTRTRFHIPVLAESMSGATGHDQPPIRRIADDGNSYTEAEFANWYGPWYCFKWDQAPSEMVCVKRSDWNAIHNRNSDLEILNAKNGLRDQDRGDELVLVRRSHWNDALNRNNDLEEIREELERENMEPVVQ